MVQQSESEGTYLSHPTVKASDFSEPYNHSVTRLHVAVLQYKDSFTFLRLHRPQLLGMLFEFQMLTALLSNCFRSLHLSPAVLRISGRGTQPM